ncbi:hypothetical protein [Calothrix sp. 336/3]|nr:hypothetical protein [Calothrix sp. 336/3]AKG24587.1 hypothetical protein IJ00_11380 [Calothrix sp. 336/3]
MLDRINDIAWQAHQGSVAAIIQVLNEKLASSGVRTRAMFDDGILQLLCEAQTPDKLEQSSLVGKVKEILETIAPRNIHKVNINSRIVREEQLLWLEEINRNSENQLLWSEEINLAKQNVLHLLVNDFSDHKAESDKIHFRSKPSASKVIVNTQQYPQKRWGVSTKTQRSPFLLWFLSVGVFSLGIVGAIYLLQNHQNKQFTSEKSLNTVILGDKKIDESKTPENKPYLLKQKEEETFLAAVRSANQADSMGKKAKTSAQWLDVAARWQRASDLMSQVPQSYSRYQEAMIRTKLYKQYSQAAQKEAEKNNSKTFN